MSWLEDFKYRVRTPKQMQRLDDNTYYGGNLGGVTITKKRKKPYWVSPRGAGNMTVMPGDPEMVFFAPIAAGAGIAASPVLLSAGSAAMNGVNAAGDALAATAAGQRLTSGLNFVANAVGNSKAWPWMNAGLTSAFGAQGIDKVRRGDIHNVGDVVETGLDLLPLAQLARPIVSTVSRVGSTIQRGTNNLVRNLAGPDGKIFNSQIPFNENNYYRVVNGKEAFNDLINSGLVRGSELFNRAPYFGSGKRLWKAPSKGDATIIEATPDTPVEWTTPFSEPTPSIPSKPVEYLKNPKQSDFKPGHFSEVIPWQNGSYQIPIEGFNFYRNYPLIGWRKVLLKTTLPREFPRGLISKEPLIARGTPEITAENAASITPAQWTAAQDAAIARGDMAEAQRLRDLHFKVSAPNTKVVDGTGNPQLVIHKTPNDFTVFDNSRSIGNLNWAATPKAFEGENGVFATGAGTSPKEMRLYVNMKNPHYPTIDEGMEPAFINEGEDGILGIVDKDMTDFYRSASDAGEGFNMSLGVDNPYALKSADAVTYDDKGVRIPLGERDNFKLNDIRYSWLAPFIGLGTLGISSRKQGGRLIRKFQNAGYIDYPANLFLHNYGAAILPKIDLLADKAEVYADGISTLGSGIGTVGAVTGNPILSGIGVISQIPNGIIDLYLFLRGINKGDVEQSAFNGIEFGLDLLGGKIFSKTFKPTFKPTVGSLFRSNHHSPRVRKLMDYYGKQEESKLRSKVIRDLKKRGVRKSQGLYFDKKFKERFTKEMEREVLNKNNSFEPFNKGIIGVTNALANFGILNMHLNNKYDENN